MATSIRDKVFEKLPEGWQEEILALYSKGCSDYETMFEMRLHSRLFKQLMADPEFAEVIEYGRLASRAFWERQGRINLENRDFNAQLYKLNVENRLGWSSKTSNYEADTDLEKSLNNDELEAQINDKIRKLRPVVNKEEVKGK